jgi:hypothetical protein
MELKIVNPRPKYRPPRLVEPPPMGYLHVAAAVEPPAGRSPLPGRSARKAALLSRLTSLATELEDVDEVVRATVYRAVVVPPPGGYAKQAAAHPARYDVVVLVETTSPGTIAAAQGSGPCKEILDALHEASSDLHTMAARCRKCIADVDKTRQGLFLFNYFVAEDKAVALELWDHLAGWYAAETGLDNSTLLDPIGDADYAFINHARWDQSLARFALYQFTKPSFRSYVLANLLVNRTGSMPVLYHRV